MRVGITFDNLGPYHVARIRGAADHVDVVAVEVAARSTDYSWDRPELPGGLERVVLTERPEDRRDSGRLAALIERKVAPLGLDAIAVPGWSSLASLRLTHWATRRRIPVIGMSDSNAWNQRRKPAAEAIKRGIVAHYAAGMGMSTSHADYLVALGMPRDAVFFGYDAVDNDYFDSTARAVRAAPFLPARVAAILPEAARGAYFLVPNRFIEVKNLPRLLRAYAAFRAGRRDDPADWPMVLVGDGDERPAIEALRAELGLERHLHMPGFAQYGELPDYYGTAGALVQASLSDTWGLVMNEAMASGLPVAVSERCGCAEVLVRDGVNGVVFDPFSQEAITAALQRIAAADLAAMGEESRAIIADWGPDRFGSGIAEAARLAVEAGRRPGLADRLALKLAERWMGR
jgi:glycosyltransferase involved in cell wall biosynthesis